MHPCYCVYVVCLRSLFLVVGDCIPLSVYSFIVEGHSGLFAVWAHYDENCFKHLHMDFCMNMPFHFSWMTT